MSDVSWEDYKSLLHEQERLQVRVEELEGIVDNLRELIEDNEES